MARNKNDEAGVAGTDAQTDGTATAAATAGAPADGGAAAVTEARADERYRMVRDPDTGVETKRVDFIRKRWQEGKSRGAIAKELTQLTGKQVKYQIVFQATRGVTGGPPKEAAQPAAGTTGDQPTS